jgi:hypothetical protein
MVNDRQARNRAAPGALCTILYHDTAFPVQPVTSQPICVGFAAAQMVVAGVDDPDIALAHLDALLDHLRGIDLVVTRCIQQVGDRRRADEKVVQLATGDVLAGGEKVDLAVQVGAQVVAVRKQLPVGNTISNCATRCP